MKKHYRSENNCLNCGTTVTDKFCPSCGQENLELHDNFLHLVLHSVSHYFHFESKFFNSIVPLFTKPGYLTKEYFAGKRASHLNPISMYIFISILFFFLFTANSNSNKKDIMEENAAQGSTITKDEAEKVKTVVGNTVSEKAGAYTYTILDNAQIIKDSASNRNDAVVYTNPTAAKADSAEKKGTTISFLDESALPLSLKDRMQKVMDDDLSGQLFINKLVSHLPKMMFILLPLFALILKLVHVRSRKQYAEHLIYSIHVHSFLFLFGSILIVLNWLLPFFGDWIQFLGVVVILWYIYRSMRNIYKSTRWRTVYKFFLLAFAYTFLMLMSGFIVVVATLYTI
ncbi:DUF3667 domain-containing protein [Pontibacter anaerobius]|uniref:DUF3667 domain-containing protein n=1 Tax=Pontibacter anaerobius TaxID=2993940 RepID=A0ABT3RCA8_9BACT|nr:DUF3667 domain-containing protein [Pontibacter anaerobius]MCX2739484.1 DUF3667 domain-containing protein [Pontibacter anaerobius]